MIAPTAPAPILSDDGWWQWDGSAWVPADDPPVSTPVLQGPPEWATWSMPASAAATRPWSGFASRADAAVPPGGHAAGSGLPPGPGYAASPRYAPPPGYAAPTAYGPPIGYFPPGYPDRPQEGRDRLAIAALVCSLIPVFVVAQLAAIVFAIVTLTRVGRTRKKGQVMAIVAIAISVLMFFISAAIAIPVFLNQRQASYDVRTRSALRNTAEAEEAYLAQNGTYGDAAELNASGVQVPADLGMVVAADGPAGYCLAAGRTGGTRWRLYDSFHGGLQTTVFAGADDAIETCTSAATAGSGGSALSRA